MSESIDQPLVLTEAEETLVGDALFAAFTGDRAPLSRWSEAQRRQAEAIYARIHQREGARYASNSLSNWYQQVSAPERDILDPVVPYSGS